MGSRTIAKYLLRYAEPEIAQLSGLPLGDKHYRHTLVIPAFDEPPDFLSRVIADVAISAPTLIICVINAPANPASDQQQAIARTEKLWTGLADSGSLLCRNEEANLCLIQLLNHPMVDLLLVDRFSPQRRIPNRQAVGLARKIGNDIAVALMAGGSISDPWIHNTDADVSLPTDYFADQPEHTVSAGLHPFRHQAEPGLELAMDLYELHLHYYVLALAWAGSPYAFHTIGSTIAVSAEKYCEVRGFPRRNGAEDFHLLNKLAKVGTITPIAGEPIVISGRPSQRVPFGTGPALQAIADLPNPLQEYRFYDFRVFLALRHWLNSANNIWQENAQNPGRSACNLLEKVLESGDVSRATAERLYVTLAELGVVSAIDHALSHSRSAHQFSRHLHTWFDGLKTLQFIHALEERGYPRQSLAATLDNDFFRELSANRGWNETSAARLRDTLLARLQ